MSKHTPGPWEVGEWHEFRGSGRQYCRISQAGEMYEHAEVWSAATNQEGKANARLIAAAPDLFAACEDVIGTSIRLGVNEDRTGGEVYDHLVANVFPSLISAIAKAREPVPATTGATNE